FLLYQEMRQMAYDPSGMLEHTEVFLNGSAHGADTVQMNIMAYDYFRFNDSALTTDYAFEFDTITNEITEKFPCELFPYVTHRVFASSPTGYNLLRQNVYFRIDPAFIFHDQFNDIAGNGWVLEIDFGDGVGYRTINPSTISYILVNYTTGGAKQIKTRIKASGVSIMTSIAEILTPNKSDPRKPDTRIHLPGLTAGIYEPCEESGGPYKKMI